MKCDKCGGAPWQGFTLLRQNPKGQPGVFRCEACLAKHGGKAPGADVAQVVAELQRSGAGGTK